MVDGTERIRLANRMLALLGEIPNFADRCPPTPALAGEFAEIYDGPGESAQPLFLRLSLGSRGHDGYADVAAQDWLGQPLLGLQHYAPWQPQRVLDLAGGLHLEVDRWFSFNRRDVALACHRGDTRVYLDGVRGKEKPCFVSESEIVSWAAILGPERRAFNTALYDEFRGGTAGTLTLALGRAKREAKSLICAPDSSPPDCVALLDQEYDGWCVPATVESLLAFHGVRKTQEKVAYDLGMDSNSSGVDVKEFGAVIKLIEQSDSGSLNAGLVDGNKWGWKFAKKELNSSPGGRPFMAVAGNHARGGAGYAFFSLTRGPVEGLILADPWGGLACWETIDAAGDFGISIEAL